MKTANVYRFDGEKIVLNEKFLPGLIAAALIYWCDTHRDYHIREDHGEDVASHIVREAAKCNDMPAWADGQPLNPKTF